jgi:predicted ATP-dependent serine protease
MASNMWECSDCGGIEHGKYPPDECTSCWALNSFAEVPEDAAEILKDNVLEDIRKNRGAYEDEEDY